eukprot:CAMPEP_0198489690 /NCGR_PEP_ID=MMETSP1462-20131121/1659_1 /TAXON_ID=1333877 /ORGANISM="Brandtodinium nutriculum, Strain RCC3387" /LENGTH=44 /DNA_ID= /DNA_START= /DNA_END= /DNA_ORIENTATION=
MAQPCDAALLVARTGAGCTSPGAEALAASTRLALLFHGASAQRA